MATNFVPRLAAPAANNKYYRGRKYGGYNIALVINEKTGSTLPNCCGLVHGRWLECIGSTNIDLDKLCTGNAKNYFGMAQYAKLPTGKTPKLGAIICYDDGKLGHVAFVEKIVKDSKGQPFSIYTSNSSYGGSRWYYRTVYASKNYEYNNMKLLGFIYNPNIVDKPDPLAVGDTVEIIAPGRASSYGTTPNAYGIGWHRKIKAIYPERPYPYQVGTDKATTGFYKAEALKKI